MSAPIQNWFWIRGLVREAGHWGSLPAQFEARIPHTRVHCLELPGNGKLFQLASPLSMKGNADFLQSTVDKITAAQRAQGTTLAPPLVLSISLGSMAAIEWVSRAPHQFAGVVLINTSVRGINPLSERFRFSNLPLLLRTMLETNIRRREKKILQLTSNRPENYDSVAQTWSAIQMRHPVSRPNAIRQLTAAGLFAPRRKIQLPPLLILQSEKDRLLNAHCAQALHDKWGGELHYHPSAGHDLPLDDGNWMLDQIESFQNRLTSKEPRDAERRNQGPRL